MKSLFSWCFTCASVVVKDVRVELILRRGEGERDRELFCRIRDDAYYNRI